MVATDQLDESLSLSSSPNWLRIKLLLHVFFTLICCYFPAQIQWSVGEVPKIRRAEGMLWEMVNETKCNLESRNDSLFYRSWCGFEDFEEARNYIAPKTNNFC